MRKAASSHDGYLTGGRGKLRVLVIDPRFNRASAVFCALESVGLGIRVRA